MNEYLAKRTREDVVDLAYVFLKNWPLFLVATIEAAHSNFSVGV